MDLEPSLKRAALTVAGSLHRFAQRENWGRDSYRIFMSVNPDWGVFNIRLVAEVFNQGWRFEVYKSIMEFLDHDLPNPKPYLSVSLVLGSFAEGDSSQGRGWGPNTIEIDDALLNPDLKETRALS